MKKKSPWPSHRNSNASCANSPNVTPIMTRDHDVFMSKTDRVDFAEKLEGDLFICIHANAQPNITPPTPPFEASNSITGDGPIQIPPYRTS